jgi:acetyl esterase/lipase
MIQRCTQEEFYAWLQSGSSIELDRVPQGLDISEVGYVKRPERELKLDVYDRCNAASSLRPALVFVHGGGWFQGNRDQFARHAAYFAHKYGMYCISVEHRFSSEAPFPACLLDVKCALRWLHTQAGKMQIDTKRIGICGTSSGGHLAALLCATNGYPEYDGPEFAGYPSSANLCLLINPALDLLPLALRPGPVGEYVRNVMACDPESERHPYIAASPFACATPKMPPTFIIHGDADQEVPIEQSMMFHEKLLRMKVPSELKICPGRRHGWHKHGADFWEALSAMDEFISRNFSVKSGNSAETHYSGADCDWPHR